MESYLDRHPEMQTFAAATADPTFGQSFRQVMDQVGRLEGSGLIEKGSLENWKQNRFVDTRTGYKPGARPEEQSLEQRADTAFAKDPKTRTPEDLNVIAGWTTSLSEKQRLGHPITADDKLKADYATVLQKPEATRTPEDKQIISAFEQMMRVEHPVQPPNLMMLPGGTAAAGQRNLTFVNPKTGDIKTTSVTLPVNFDLNRVMKTIKDAPVPNKQFPGRPDYKDIQVFDPEQVKQAYRTGELGGDDVLRSIINSGQFADPADAENLAEFLKQQRNPFGR